MRKIGAGHQSYFVGSLPGPVNELELRRYFEEFGRLISLDIIKKRNTNLCKGYGFLAIALHCPEREFLAKSHVFEDRVLTIEPFVLGSKLSFKKIEFKNRRLFVKNLSPQISDIDLKDYFSQFGQVDNAYTAKNYDLHKKGGPIGCVHFKDSATIEKVLSQNLHFICGHLVKCERFQERGGDAKWYHKRFPHNVATKSSANFNSSEPYSTKGFPAQTTAKQITSGKVALAHHRQVLDGGCKPATSYIPSTEQESGFTYDLRPSESNLNASSTERHLASHVSTAISGSLNKVFQLRHKDNGSNIRFNILKPHLPLSSLRPE